MFMSPVGVGPAAPVGRLVGGEFELVEVGLGAMTAGLQDHHAGASGGEPPGDQTASGAGSDHHDVGVQLQVTGGFQDIYGTAVRHRRTDRSGVAEPGPVGVPAVRAGHPVGHQQDDADQRPGLGDRPQHLLAGRLWRGPEAVGVESVEKGAETLPVFGGHGRDGSEDTLVGAGVGGAAGPETVAVAGVLDRGNHGVAEQAKNVGLFRSEHGAASCFGGEVPTM
jgi:hypothetical protein